MKHKYLLFGIVLLFCCYCFSAHAFEDKFTHPILTKAATVNLDLKKSLIAYIGDNAEFNKVFKGKDRNGNTKSSSVLEWLQTGSTDEDELSTCRASSHFHNPVFHTPDPDVEDWYESKMSDSYVLADSVCALANRRYSTVTFATGFLSPTGPYMEREGQDMGWDNARTYLHEALTTTDSATRDAKFAKTFRSVGMVMHLLQDMAVPAHVRNDMTSHLINGKSVTKWMSNPFEKYVVKNSDTKIGSPVKPTFAAPIRVTDFWDNNSYTGENPSAGQVQGLAEYTNANFVSDFTIFKPVSDTYHFFKYPAETSTQKVNAHIKDPFNWGKTLTRKYYLKNKDGDTGYLLAGVGYLDVKVGIYPYETIKRILPMDDNVHAAYAEKLLPRAVGYSAALLDYFFRGKLEISPPSQMAYSVLDGSKASQVFTKIRAKVKNVTPGETITNGTLVAVARYKIDPNYTPDLSSDPVSNPAAAYVYSVSAPVAVDPAINTTPTEFTFNFGGSPIPAGITDLTLQVVFKGTLGNETDIAVAVGMRNISEPTHHVFWNLSDMYSLYYNLYTAETIRADADLKKLAGSNPIDPYSMDFEIGYNATDSASSVAPTQVSATLPAGRHLRLISLFDLEIPAYVEFFGGRSGEDLSDFVGVTATPAVVENGSSSGGITPFRYWDSAGVHKPFRQHMDTGLVSCTPPSYRADGNPFCAYPEAQAIAAERLPYAADPIQ